MSKFLPLAPLAPRGCVECAFHKPCGGLEQQAFYGCFSGCGSCGVEEGSCDYTCPRKTDFWRDMAEVGGINPKQHRVLPDLGVQMPLYVPTVRHGYTRDEALPVDTVCMNAFEVLDAACRVNDCSAEALRERFKVAPHAKVLLVSVNQDKYIESFWKHRTPASLAALSQLGIVGMTAPNFSFFEDAPRINSVRNMWRIIRCAEELADVGIAPVLHLNALSHEDWKAWARVLRENPAVHYICKEFQTGLRDPVRAAEAMRGLYWLQDEVGRDLHPLVVGGRRMARQFAGRFAGFSILDSVPFFATVKRKRIVVTGTSATQVDNPTAPEEALDRLLQDNIRTYRKLVELCSKTDTVSVPEAFDEEDAGDRCEPPLNADSAVRGDGSFADASRRQGKRPFEDTVAEAPLHVRQTTEAALCVPAR